MLGIKSNILKTSNGILQGQNQCIINIISSDKNQGKFKTLSKISSLISIYNWIERIKCKYNHYSCIKKYLK